MEQGQLTPKAAEWFFKVAIANKLFDRETLENLKQKNDTMLNNIMGISSWRAVGLNKNNIDNLNLGTLIDAVMDLGFAMDNIKDCLQKDLEFNQKILSEFLNENPNT